MPRQAMLGNRVRRLRNHQGLTQVAMAAQLGISPSYLNLIEHNQRSLNRPLLLKLSECFDIDLQAFSGNHEARLLADLTELLGDPLFQDAELGPAELNERGVLSNVLPVVAFPETRLFREAGALGLTLHMRTPHEFEALSRGWHAPIARDAISVSSLDLDRDERVEAVLKLRLRQRERLGYRTTPELFRTMEHLPGLRVPGETELMVERYEPVLAGPRFGGPVRPSRIWTPEATT